MKFNQVILVIDIHFTPQKSLVTIQITRAFAVTPVPISVASIKAGALRIYAFAPLTPLHWIH
jgi:hypothetical protein